MHCLPLITQSRFHGLNVLKFLALNPVLSAIPDEDSPCLHEAERYIPSSAFLPQRFHPGIITGSCPAVIFSPARDLLNLAAVKILTDADWSEERSTVQSLMPEREFQKQRNPLIRPMLIFACHVQEEIVPPISPVCRQVLLYSLRPLGQKQEDDIASCAHHVPGFGTPGICFLQKKIRSHADTDCFTTLYFVSVPAVF